MIVEAVIPLLLEHGASVTSRQIAEAAGIAEGTVFRAFGDKDTLVAAAVARYLEPTALHNRLRLIDGHQPLATLLAEVLAVLRERFIGVMRMMAAAGMHHGQVPRRPVSQEFTSIISDLLQPHRENLRIAPEQVAQYARLVAFASAIPVFGEGVPFSTNELVDLFEQGVLVPSASSGKA